MLGRPVKKVIISLDYDDCADILFDDLLAARPGEHIYAIPEQGRSKVQACRAQLMGYLESITAVADVVELYVGSNRQDRVTDQALSTDNINGSCFANFRKLCKEKNWIFREFLLADAQQKLPAGTAMYADKIRASTTDKSKSAIIKEQLNDIKNNHSPSDHIEFYFIDDDNNDCYLLDLEKSFTSEKLPINIKKFSLVKYDWHDAVFHNAPEGILYVHKEITQSQKVSCSNSEYSELPSLSLLSKKSSPNNIITVIPTETTDCVNDHEPLPVLKF